MAYFHKPTIVLVPGVWDKARLYGPLTSRLEQAGYEVYPIDYPSSVAHPDEVPANFELDVVTIRSALAQIADHGDDIVLVVHSVAGLIAGEAAKGMSKKDREEQGQPGGIVRMVYLCAFAASEGVIVYMAKNGPDSWHRIEGAAVYVDNPKEIFYNLCSDEVAEANVAQLSVFAKGTFESKPTYATWRHIPSTYLVCEQGQAIPLAAQEHMISQPGAKFQIVRCGADHSPFLSMPDFTADVVRRSAGEFIVA